MRTPNLEQQAKAAADAFRLKHGLGTQPLGDLIELIEQTTGHDVAVVDAEEGEHGLTMRDPERDVVYIGIARSQNPMRQRSTLAHELGHLLLGDCADGAGYADRSPEEIRADAFARHLLIPIEGIRELFGIKRLTEAELSVAVQRFLVSPQMAAIAFHAAGRISAETKSAWLNHRTPQLATKYGWTDHYESLQSDSYQLRAPQGLLKRAIAGYLEGVVTAQTIAALRGVPVENVINELEEAGLSPVVREPADIDVAQLPDVNVDLSALDEDGGSINP